MESEEILTINIGKCGIRVGDAVWAQYCFEHGIDENGSLNKLNRNKMNKPTSVFAETKNNMQYKARNIMIDTEPDVIESIMNTSKYSKLYDEKYLIYGNEDSGNNFARCYYKIENELLENIQNTIRKVIEKVYGNYGCNFILNYSIGGGTGSALSRILMEDVLNKFFPTINFNICPFDNQYSECYVDVYNALFCLGSDRTPRHTVLLDNKAIYGLCKNELGINKPSMNDLNSLISIANSFYTDYKRFDSYNIKDNMVNQEWEWPFGYFDDYDYMSTTWTFPLISPLINPLEGKKDVLCNGFIRNYWPMNIVAIYDDILRLIYNHYDVSSKKLINFQNPINVFEHVWKAPYSSMLEMFPNDDHDINIDNEIIQSFWDVYQMIICSLCNFRGKNITQNDLDLCKKTMLNFKNERKLHLLDRYYRFRFGDGKYYFTKNNNIPLNNNKLDSQCVLFCNGDPIQDFLQRRILNKCEKMYKMKAFWHHFTNEGMEELEFKERMNNLKDILYFYRSLHHIGQTDEDYDDDDDD